MLRVAQDERARLPSLSATTNSNPSIVGSIVMKEIVPSSFFRDATALCHSPTSKTTVAVGLLHVHVAERRARVARGELRRGGGVRRDDEPLALLGDRGLARCFDADPDLLLGLGLAVEEHLERGWRRSGPRSATPESEFVRMTAPTPCSGSQIMSLW